MITPQPSMLDTMKATANDPLLTGLCAVHMNAMYAPSFRGGRCANGWQYDMLTAPITTSHFRDRVFSQCEDLDANGSPVVSPLRKEDSDLAPGSLTPQLLAMASPWIDLSSPDPLIYSVSRQVLHLEIAFASFCGVANVIVPGPKLHHGNVHGNGVAQYAYTIQEILEIGIYHQVHLRLSMSEDPATDRLEQIEALSTYARPQFEGQGREKQKIRSDAFGTWDAWNIVRSICRYKARLFVGKVLSVVASLFP